MFFVLTSPIWVLLLTPLGVTAQWANWENQNPQISKENFFMDSNAECNQQYDIGENSALLHGHGAVLEQHPPKTCQITFSTDSVREKRKFRIEVISASFDADGVQFYVYDSSTTENLLFGFGFGKDKPPNFAPLITSGGFVTFQLVKAYAGQADYNIKCHIISIPGDVSVIDECPGGEGPGCNYYFYQSPITKEIIIGIVGGVFGLILFVIAPIVIICCYRKSKGVNRRWDEFKLGQTNTAANISSSKASVRATSHDTKSKLWASQSSKMGLSSVNKPPRSRGRLSEDDDSVFDDGPPRSYPPPPPPYERYDRSDRQNRDDYDSRPRRYDRYDSRDEDYDRKDRRYRDRDDDRFDRRNRREFDRRQRDPSPRRSVYSDSNSEMESSFVQAEDDHPQERFVERIIEPRVKPKAKTRVKKPVEEDVYDELSEDVEALRDSSVQCGPSDDDNESNTETTDDDSSETESDSEDEKKKVDPRTALYSKPNKKGKNKNGEAKQPPQPGMAAYPPGPVMAGTNMGQPMIGHPMVGHPIGTGRPLIPGVIVRPVTQPQFATGHYPPVIRPGVPIQPGLMQFRPVQPPNQTGARLPQVQVPQKSHPSQHRAASNPPQDPPLFSYLVQRGYTGRHSPASSGTGISSDAHVVNLTDDSDGTANLPSGVDLMKRTTDV